MSIPHYIERSGGENSEFVRLDGHRCRVVRTALGKRDYFRVEDGLTFSLDRAEQVMLAAKGRLTTDASWDKLAEDYGDILDRDWSPGCFTEQEMASAYYRVEYVKVLDRYDARERRKYLVVKGAIAEVRAETKDDRPAPSVEAVRRWDEHWLVSGRDIRVLADRNSHKGNFGGHEEFAWVDEIIEAGIDEYMVQAPYWRASELFKHLEPIVRAHSEKHSLPLRPGLRKNGYFGINRIYTLFARRNQAERSLREKGRKEALRSSKGYAHGPSGDFALHEVEVDHHMLDIEVVDESGVVIGRPWLTALIDRYSRLIIGIYITMEPPSWFSVMMCLRLGVMPKEAFLASLPYEFTREWNCMGTMDILYMDRGAEFRSQTIKAAASVLKIRLVDIPRARGDLKGKIERFFGTYESQIAKLPGYVGSSPKYRLEETAIPRLTLPEVQLVSVVWVVDIYNYEVNSTTGQRPAERYQKSMESSLAFKLPPPLQLLGPATSIARQATLTQNGIKLDTLQYKSDALRNLWFKTGNRQVLVRPDEDDATLVLVHDGAKKWIEARLQGKYADVQMTRRELDRKRKADKKAQAASPEEHEKDLKARANYGALIDRLAPRQKKPKAIRQTTSAATHLSRQKHDPKTSVKGLLTPAGIPVQLDLYDGLGPFAKPSLTQKVLEGQVILPPPDRNPSIAQVRASAAADETPSPPNSSANGVAVPAQPTSLKSRQLL